MVVARESSWLRVGRASVACRASVVRWLGFAVSAGSESSEAGVERSWSVVGASEVGVERERGRSRAASESNVERGRRRASSEVGVGR